MVETSQNADEKKRVIVVIGSFIPPLCLQIDHLHHSSSINKEKQMHLNG